MFDAKVLGRQSRVSSKVRRKAGDSFRAKVSSHLVKPAGTCVGVSFFRKLKKKHKRRKSERDPPGESSAKKNRPVRDSQSIRFGQSSSNSRLDSESWKYQQILSQMANIRQKLKYQMKTKFDFECLTPGAAQSSPCKQSNGEFDHKRLNRELQQSTVLRLNYTQQVQPVEPRKSFAKETERSFLSFDDIKRNRKRRFNFARLIKQRDSAQLQSGKKVHFAQHTLHSSTGRANFSRDCAGTDPKNVCDVRRKPLRLRGKSTNKLHKSLEVDRLGTRNRANLRLRQKRLHWSHVNNRASDK